MTCAGSAARAGAVSRVTRSHLFINSGLVHSMPIHEVKQGEHIAGIASQFGLKIEVIWDDPQNADLKARRKNPNVLLPGDQLFIPDKQDKVEQKGTGSVHKFEVEGATLKLKLLIKDESDEPVANTQCKLNVQGVATVLSTDGDAKIAQPIAPLDKDAMLDIGGVEIPIKIGHLDPVDEVSGQKGRLNNLGYDAGPVDEDDDDRFKSAVEEFQCDQKIKPINGVCDGPTQAKLKSVHGS